MDCLLTTVMNLQKGWYTTFIQALDSKLQDDIKTMLIKIDFQDGDVMHFFQHLANGMVSMRQ